LLPQRIEIETARHFLHFLRLTLDQHVPWFSVDTVYFILHCSAY